MSKEFPCRWPTGIETLRIRKGHLANGTLAVSMRIGRGVGGSVHLTPDDAIEVAQALAVERAKLMPMGMVCRSLYPCTFFGHVNVECEPHSDEEGDAVMVTVGKGLAYLSKADAKALAMDLLAMTADEV